MKIISVNVGTPRLVEYNGEPVVTAIYKSPVEGKVQVNPQNLAGDAQADLRVHGGASKSVYAYPFEHYGFWQNEYPDKDLPIAIFGENLTTEGILETEICAGDRIRVGTAEFIVTEPRFPCFKLGIRFERKDIIRRFQKSRRSGFYLSVAKTGEIKAGDAIEFIERDPNRVTIEELVRLADEKNVLEIAQRALKVEALPERWKEQIRKILA
ncbi:MAG TPA: MOSC domain-containing protein [Pyrinomonadaceae bacterium]|nr:MOSC domain-containing protein [Pyrinomonadaceae bacterium]